jgi:hypothetical protein
LQVSVNDRDAALASFAQAREYYGKGDDSMRVAIHEIIQLQGANKSAEARALAQKMIAASPHSPAVDLLRALTEPRLPAPPAAAQTANSAKH